MVGKGLKGGDGRVGSTSGGRVESGCSHCCIYRGHFSTTWPVFLQTKQRQSQEGSEVGSVRGLGTVGVAEVLADGSWWVRLRGGWDGGRSEFPVVVSPLAVGEVEESESLRDRLPSRESVFMGLSSMVEWDFPVNRLDSDNEATTTPYVSTVDYLIMYEVVVYISHTVWTSESSHDGMQGNIQFTDKCIMYWLNGQNIHYEIVFSQAYT